MSEPNDIETWKMLPNPLRAVWASMPDLQDRFHLRTITDVHAFIGWCITDGIEQNGISPAVIHDGLDMYLDSIEGEADSSTELPATTLMKIMRPLYTGHCQDQVGAGQNPEYTSGLLAAWLCTTARRYYEWPDTAVTSLRRKLCTSSAYFDPNEPGLTIAMAAIYKSRPDVQAAFKLDLEPTHGGFAGWMVNNGIFEYDWDPSLIPEPFRDYLRRPETNAHSSALTNFHFLTWKGRPHVWESLPLSSADQETAFVDWVQTHRRQDRVFRFWLPLLFGENRCHDNLPSQRESKLGEV